MEVLIGKTATRAWRDSGMETSFKDFITDYKEKMSADGVNTNLVLVDRTLNDSVQNAINEAVAAGGFKTEPENKTIFGVNKTVFIVSAVAFTGGLIYLITTIIRKS